MTRVMSRMALAAAVVCVTAVGSLAQQQTSSSTESKSFEIIATYGNTLVVKLPEGTRELTVPDDFRFTVNGKQLTLHELAPGMKGTATITTRTTVTPVTVTEVKNGTVVERSGSMIIVRTAEGVRSFTQGEVDKRGVKLVREGKPAQLSQFRPGDQISATIITSMPPHVLTEKEVQAIAAPANAARSGGAPAVAPARPPSPAAASSSAATASSAGTASSASTTPSAATTRSAAATPAPAAQSQTASTLPKTASEWPLLGLASLLLLAVGLALTIRRLVH